MYKAISLLCTFFVGCFTNTNLGATLKEVLPIKNVWSINACKDGSKMALRFKGKEDLSQIVQFQNIGLTQIRDMKDWGIVNQLNNARFCRFSSNSSIAGVTFGDGTAQIVDLKNNVVVKEFLNVWSIHFSPDSTICRIIFTTNKTQFFETQKWQLIKEFEYTEQIILGFSPDSKNVGIAFTDGTVDLVAIEDWNVIQKFTNIANFGLSFSPDGTYLVLVGKDNLGTLITTKDWQPVKMFEEVKLLEFCENGAYLHSKRIDDSIQIIDAQNWHVLFEQSNVLFHDISSDSNYVWIISKDMSAQVIDLKSGNAIITNLQNVEECCFYSMQKIAIALQDEIEVHELA